MVIQLTRGNGMALAMKDKAKADEVVESLRVFVPRVQLEKSRNAWVVVLTMPSARRLAKTLDEARGTRARASQTLSEIRRLSEDLEVAKAEIAALKQIMKNEGVPVPADPPPARSVKRRYIHRVHGSFESGKRR